MSRLNCIASIKAYLITFLGTLLLLSACSKSNNEAQYSAVEQHLLQTGACSVTGGIAIAAIPEAAAAA